MAWTILPARPFPSDSQTTLDGVCKTGRGQPGTTLRSRRRVERRSNSLDRLQHHGNDHEHLYGVEDAVRHDARQDVAVDRERDGEHGADDEDSDEDQRLSVRAMRGGEH